MLKKLIIRRPNLFTGLQLFLVYVVSMVLFTKVSFVLLDTKDTLFAVVFASILSGLLCIGLVTLLQRRSTWVTKTLCNFINHYGENIPYMDVNTQYGVILAMWWIWDINYFYPPSSKPPFFKPNLSNKQ